MISTFNLQTITGFVYEGESFARSDKNGKNKEINK